jgi:DNA adenine methylase
MGENSRPFLKWAGNKYRVIDRIKKKLPKGRRLVEPFVGSGAVFLNTDYEEYLLCDINEDLISLYTIVRDDVESLIKKSRRYFDGSYNNEKNYYELRDKFNRSRNPMTRAVLFIYLNRHGYNGLCRYNSKGEFNIPHGRYRIPYFPEKEIREFHVKAQRAVFSTASFDETMQRTRSGDTQYLDPPYVELSKTASFTAYAAGGFTLDQHEQIATLAHLNAQRGIPVLISNHSTAFTRSRYRSLGARISYFSVQRSISCKGNARGKAKELLALFESTD